MGALKSEESDVGKKRKKWKRRLLISTVKLGDYIIWQSPVTRSDVTSS